MWEKVISVCIKDSEVGLSQISHGRARKHLFPGEESAFEKERGKTQRALQWFTAAPQNINYRNNKWYSHAVFMGVIFHVIRKD